MTVDTFEKALHNRLEIPKGKVNQRNGACVCVLGVDIGAYDTCGHLCKYCYANADKALVRANMKKHNPESPFLIGESMPEMLYTKRYRKAGLTGSYGLIIFIRLSVLTGYRYSYRISEKE